MKSYIAYHSTEGMGYELQMSDQGAAFLSNKGLRHLHNVLGNKVWIITGTKGASRSKDYCLVGYYIPSEVGESTNSNFDWSISGEEVHIIEPPVYLNDKKWFPHCSDRKARSRLGLLRSATHRSLRLWRDWRGHETAYMSLPE